MQWKQNVVLKSCEQILLYRMYTKYGIQEEQSIKYLNTKFGEDLIQTGSVWTTYTWIFI